MKAYYAGVRTKFKEGDLVVVNRKTKRLLIRRRIEGVLVHLLTADGAREHRVPKHHADKVPKYLVLLVTGREPTRVRKGKEAKDHLRYFVLGAKARS